MKLEGYCQYGQKPVFIVEDPESIAENRNVSECLPTDEGFFIDRDADAY